MGERFVCGLLLGAVVAYATTLFTLAVLLYN